MSTSLPSGALSPSTSGSPNADRLRAASKRFGLSTTAASLDELAVHVALQADELDNDMPPPRRLPGALSIDQARQFLAEVMRLSNGNGG